MKTSPKTKQELLALLDDYINTIEELNEQLDIIDNFLGMADQSAA